MLFFHFYIDVTFEILNISKVLPLVLFNETMYLLARDLSSEARTAVKPMENQAFRKSAFFAFF